MTDRLAVSDKSLERGTVVLLAHRIVLLLHRTTVPSSPPPRSFGLLGASDALLDLQRSIARVADVDVPVLIRGATGSGKELVARALHAHGPRPGGPFVPVNIGALSPALAAAELFGSRKGAFTGAIRDQRGYFARAHGGTLFLDEIGEAPPEIQVLLLRALETGEIQPVGSTSPQKTDLRLVAATDAPLEGMVAEGGFRAPLLHRLAGYRLEVPSLAERRDDIGRLLQHFMAEESRRLGSVESSDNTEAPDLDPILVARIALHDWPGNVRELRNVARELVIDQRGGESHVLSRHLDDRLPSWAPPSGSSSEASEERPVTRLRKPSEIQEEELIEALRNNCFDLKATAQQLGVSRTGLYARLDRSPNVRTAAEVPEEEIRRAHERHGGRLDSMVSELEISERALRQRLRDLGLR